MKVCNYVFYYYKNFNNTWIPLSYGLWMFNLVIGLENELTNAL